VRTSVRFTFNFETQKRINKENRNLGIRENPSWFPSFLIS
jgi:hypothetical protein